jgi:hypothetical protein
MFRAALAAILIAATPLFLAGCAAGPGGPGVGPAATPYKGDQPWNISSRGGPTNRSGATAPG